MTTPNTSYIHDLVTLGEVHWTHLYGGAVELTFTNAFTGATETRRYKTEAAAKGAETKWIKRMCRTYTRH